MVISATKLRSNLYNIIDGVITSGVPVEIELRGRKVVMMPTEAPDKLSRLVKRRGVIQASSSRLPAAKTFDENKWRKKWEARLK